ncbi:rhamnulokinase [Brevibacillus massiliensis]|uniref:rhamnulokinase n=1 Tax=Brevibacillus massiliensis TaxID=1118054 RepID=UPI0002E9EC52|nr:rhamnulokinase family protein [Brevibacillus massiliensis]
MNVLAFDLGASSGRAVAGRVDGNRLAFWEIHRFENSPVRVGERLYWDVLRLFHEMKQGLLKARQTGFSELHSVGIDTWGVDFGLIGAHGELLGNPYHYRDSLIDGKLEEVCAILPKREIFARTGIQFMPINSLYRLYALKQSGSPLLEQAASFLMMPDLLRYFLTGEKKSEWTNASTTQLYNPLTRSWDEYMLQSLGLPAEMFADAVEPGQVVGVLQPSLCTELECPSLPVVAVGEHDTASAVAAIPALTPDFAYLSCGTWSLLGTEVPQPVLNDQALEWNFTNEGGVNRTFRLLKNIMGLWLFEECRRCWAVGGTRLRYDEMVALAHGAKPFQRFIEPDDPMFLHPAHMPKQIQQYCRDTGQSVPESAGEILRCVLESLAMKYRLVLERTEMLSGKRFSGLHLVGGGVNNALLCQCTANAIGRPVWAGPAEATALGNLAVQLIAHGQIRDIREARALLSESLAIKSYEPQEAALWNEAYGLFRQVTACH